MHAQRVPKPLTGRPGAVNNAYKTACDDMSQPVLPDGGGRIAPPNGLRRIAIHAVWHRYTGVAANRYGRSTCTGAGEWLRNAKNADTDWHVRQNIKTMGHDSEQTACSQADG